MSTFGSQDYDSRVSLFQFLAGAQLDFGRNERVDCCAAIAFDERLLGLPNQSVVPIGAGGTIARLGRSLELGTWFIEEEGFGVLQVGGVEAFGEPVVDFGKDRARFGKSASCC